jgi:hypothetical protein
MPFSDSCLQSLSKANGFLQHSWHIRAARDHTRDHTDEVQTANGPTECGYLATEHIAYTVTPYPVIG